MQPRTPEAPLPWFVNDSFAGQGSQLVDDVVPVLSTNEQAAHRTLVANAEGVMAARGAYLAQLFRGRQVGQVRLMALAGVNDMAVDRAEDVEDFLDGWHNGSSLGKDRIVAALDAAKAAGINKVALNIYDDERCCRDRKFVRVWSR